MDIKEFVSRQNWVFAKTYAKKAPHEYVVRTKVNGTDNEFISFAKFILENGMTMYYYGHPNKYLFLGGYNYWVMADDMRDPFSDKTLIINRCIAEDYMYSIRWKGLDR